MKITQEEIKSRANSLTNHIDDLDFLKSPEFSSWRGLTGGIEKCALNILEGEARYFNFLSLIKWVELLEDTHIPLVFKNIEKTKIPNPKREVDRDFYDFLCSFASFFGNIIDSISEVLDKMHCLDKEFLRFAGVVVMASSALDFLIESIDLRTEDTQ